VPPGKLTIVKVCPGALLFRGENLFVKESSPGTTRVLAMFVGKRMQLPTVDGQGIPSKSFARNPCSSDIKFDTCEQELFITFWLLNDSGMPVKWSAEIPGKAVFEEDAE
jgi:hypothetical protein